VGLKDSVAAEVARKSKNSIRKHAPLPLMDAFNIQISTAMSQLLASNGQLKNLTASCVQGRNTTHVVGRQYVGKEKSVDPTHLLSMMLQSLVWLDVAVYVKDLPAQHPEMNAAIFRRQQRRGATARHDEQGATRPRQAHCRGAHIAHWQRGQASQRSRVLLRIEH
jgi:hypothetical protein